MGSDNCGKLYNHNLTLGYRHNPLKIYKTLSKETKGHGRVKTSKESKPEPKLNTKNHAYSEMNRS